jgi:hypothetical protein
MKSRRLSRPHFGNGGISITMPEILKTVPEENIQADSKTHDCGHNLSLPFETKAKHIKYHREQLGPYEPPVTIAKKFQSERGRSCKFGLVVTRFAVGPSSSYVRIHGLHMRPNLDSSYEDDNIPMDPILHHHFQHHFGWYTISSREMECGLR